ncbi:MAG: hypothetical protein AAB895_02760, partial [Patescibacteria group bacterium]
MKKLFLFIALQAFLPLQLQRVLRALQTPHTQPAPTLPALSAIAGKPIPQFECVRENDHSETLFGLE